MARILFPRETVTNDFTEFNYSEGKKKHTEILVTNLSVPIGIKHEKKARAFFSSVLRKIQNKKVKV